MKYIRKKAFEINFFRDTLFLYIFLCIFLPLFFYNDDGAIATTVMTVVVVLCSKKDKNEEQTQ